MALVWKDKVAETSTTTGTGAFTLAGALTGYRTFGSVCSTNDTVYYSITAVDANGVPSGEWETGLGTYSGTNTLTRTTVLDSSNSGSAVSFSAGTKRVAAVVVASVVNSATADSGVTAATYGDSTHVAQVTVDAKGRVTGASSVAIVGPAFRGALVTKSADQTGANYSGAPMIAWNSEVYDTDFIHDNVTNNTRLTVPSGVSYVKVAAAVDLSSVTASSDCALVIQKNGGNATGTTRLRLSSSATVPALYVASPVLAVTAGDYFEAQLFCSDTSITVTISEGSSWFSMEIIE